MNAPTVPFFDISQQTRAIREELLTAVTNVVDSGAFILGPEVHQFETEFANYLNSRFALSCASGSDALLLALMALGVGPGDEVLVPSFTYYATASCVQRVGATPVFIDCDSSYNLSFDDLANKYSPNVKAMIPVHLFGQMVDMHRLQRWAAEAPKKVYIIEDCAQSMGAEWDGRPCGTWGDIGAFSFYPTKNLGGFGDGGMMTSQNPDFADRLKVLRVHGERKKYHHEVLGINSRLDSMQAAGLRIKLRRLKDYEAKRQAIAAKYFQCFEAAQLGDWVTLPVEVDKAKHVWNQYSVRVRDRERLMSHLQENGIGCNIYYPLPLHLQKSFAYLGYRRGDLLMSERISSEILALPIYPELPLESVERVVDSIRDFYRRG